MKKLILLATLASASVFASPYVETRICGEPARTSTGAIARDAKAVREFRRLYACPSTGLHDGACTGWSVDHVIPLACGGCDSVPNMQWLPNVIKSGKYPSKDRWERQIYNKYSCSFKVQHNG